jgi:hypothetical protein
MTTWKKSATVWINDPNKRRVVVGPFGFAWWSGKKVFIALFDGRQELPVSAYNNFGEEGEVREYLKAKVSKSAIIRCVKTGLLPG